MKLYRSIGNKELISLLDGQTIYGMYDCQGEGQNSNTRKNVCCFFVDEVRWKSADHKFMIVVDIPEERLDFGIGDYFVAKSLKDTKIWSGRNGSLHYKIREAYTLSYCIDDVKEIYLFNHFASWYVEGQIEPICDGMGIELHREYKDPFANSAQKFIKVPYLEYHCNYVTSDFSKDWLSSFNGVKNTVPDDKVSDKEIEYVMNALAGTPTVSTSEFANKIERILKKHKI